ncbi:MAG: cytidylate kinase-like family protein [Chloroflexi bacterium]|nr:cytidylate kinase-like family protein [Chloroflexota bacterium]
MSVITISREFGSVGDDFGERIAQALGYHCVCKEEIVTLLSQYGMVEFAREYETRPGFWEGFNSLRDQRRSAMVAMLNQVVQAVAQHGNVVIQGRSGFAVLTDYADVLHVRLQAPLAVRIERVAAEQKMTAEQAAAVVKEGDRVRTAFVENFYGVPWDAIHAFDLVIDTGKISPELAMPWVVDAAKALALSPATGKPSTRSIEVDSVLAKAISEVLRCTAAHS